MFAQHQLITNHECGKVMFSVVSVCLPVCLYLCLSVQTIIFEPLHIGTSFLAWMYILTISRLSLGIKVIGSRSRSCEKKRLFTYFNLLDLSICMWLNAINKVKVTNQGQGQINIELKSRSFLRRDTFESNALLSLYTVIGI